MKLVVRIFALAVVIGGAAAAGLSSSASSAMASSQSATGRLPVPTCGPNVPTCPKQQQPGR